MKKFLLLLFAAASLAACDDDKDYGPDIEHFTGRLTVTLLSDATQHHTYDGSASASQATRTARSRCACTTRSSCPRCRR